jgi:hypothetical protein
MAFVCEVKRKPQIFTGALEQPDSYVLCWRDLSNSKDTCWRDAVNTDRCLFARRIRRGHRTIHTFVDDDKRAFVFLGNDVNFGTACEVKGLQ